MSNDKAQMSNQVPNTKLNQRRERYDLEERTAHFGEEVITLAGSLKMTVVTSPLVGQVVRSATSIGANYMEADGAESKKDFQHKVKMNLIL